MSRRLEGGVARVAGEGGDVANVVLGGDVADEAVEAEAVAGVGHGAEFAEVEVPPVVVGVEAGVENFAGEGVEALLALAAADELADAGGEEVEGGDGVERVVVVAHVEGLDALGVVVDEDAGAEGGLGEPALVLGGEVGAEGDVGELPGAWILGDLGAEHVDGVGVGDAREGFVGGEGLEAREERPAAVELVEEGEVLGSVVQRGADDVLQQLLGVGLRVVAVGEGHLRLDHPKLGEVSRGVRVLGAEGRPEGVAVRERDGVRLDVELARDGEARLFPEEVLRVVDRAGRGERHVRRLALVGEQRGHRELLAGALAVGCRDEGRVDVEEALRVEELVRGESEGVSDPHDRRAQPAPRPEVRVRSQVVGRVKLLRERIVLRPDASVFPASRRAEDRHGPGAHFDRLALAH
mmetsp:Transcript_20956/g.65822  ORF Transcript_20956/g.65822 Transcript_20956/m.65822 type:complete len:409 (+) Transcript_20956:279-1505(+)